jgi:sugar/nucleoside kinase (ribokinase family)
MKLKNIDVLVIGRSCLDYIAVVNQFPQENQKIPLEFGLSEGGGQGSTASCCISRLGGKVAYVGKLGDDDVGRFCLQRLKDFGVATDFIEIIKGGKTPVAYAFITAAGGDRTIIYERNELPKITIDSTLKDLLVYAKVVLLDPEATYLGKPLHARKGDHVKIVYDGERWREGRLFRTLFGIFGCQGIASCWPALEPEGDAIKSAHFRQPYCDPWPGRCVLCLR